jgi:hypothetical protein
MKLMNLAAVILAGGLSFGAWANENQSTEGLKVDALNEQQLNEELPYLNALMNGEFLDQEDVQAEENMDLYRERNRDRDRDRDRDRWRDRDRRRDRDRDHDRDRWRRRPIYRACYARNIATGVVYRAVGFANSWQLQRLAMRACERNTYLLTVTATAVRWVAARSVASNELLVTQMI